MNYNEDYQYDSCVSRGICSVNPRTASLQEVLILYLKLTAYYALKLYENKDFDQNARNIILNTISIMISNYEFSEKDFTALMNGFSKVLPELINKYKNITGKENDFPETLHSILKFKQNTDIIKAIQLGEKEFLKKSKEIPGEIRDLYKILFVLAKSICINVLDLESFGVNLEGGYLSILKLFSELYLEESDIEKIKDFIIEVSKVDDKLMKTLRYTIEKRYGKPEITDVSYSTYPGKAILVVGSNIKELEDILEALRNENIDVYTHDEMILANNYPKFREYKNLKGQYGQGLENCLLDFATFPGPIILTRHSLYNVENLYRGLLYTTDFANSKGVIQIKNMDFSEVIEAAKKAKGFKTGRNCESVTIGYDYSDVIKKVKERRNKISRIFIIGLAPYSIEQNAYLDKLFTQVPDDVLILSLSYCVQRENVICLNACFNSYVLTELAEEFEDIPITVFFPKCDRHTISQIIYLSQKDKISIYIGKCTPIILNPNMISTFQKVFGIHSITSVKKDLEDIFNN